MLQGCVVHVHVHGAKRYVVGQGGNLIASKHDRCGLFSLQKLLSAGAVLSLYGMLKRELCWYCCPAKHDTYGLSCMHKAAC